MRYLGITPFSNTQICRFLSYLIIQSQIILMIGFLVGWIMVIGFQDKFVHFL